MLKHRPGPSLTYIESDEFSENGWEEVIEFSMRTCVRESTWLRMMTMMINDHDDGGDNGRGRGGLKFLKFDWVVVLA